MATEGYLCNRFLSGFGVVGCKAEIYLLCDMFIYVILYC